MCCACTGPRPAEVPLHQQSGKLHDVNSSPYNDPDAPSGIPWPEPYGDLLPALKSQWAVEQGPFLTRRLSGKSGALVFAADIASQDFTGQAILKLDHAPDPHWRELGEAERHRLAFEAAPEFASKHLPRLLHSLEHGSKMAILSSIAGRGLEYATPWHLCAYDRQLETIRRVSGELLEDWNSGYSLADGIQKPQSLLESWLQYRLDPDESRIHGFLADNCGIAPDEPTIAFEGHWYPNPLAFASNVIELPEKVQLRSARGFLHGDFHGFNLLVGAPATEPEYFLIDLANYESDQYLFFDHALFELNYLLYGREHVDDKHWESILDHLSYFHHLKGHEGLRGDDVGLVDLTTQLRRGLLDWVERHESNRLSYMESQYLLARVATGLNFVNKPISERSRRKAFVYAASNLKDYLKVLNVDWPKHGPAFSIREGDRGGAEAATGRDFSSQVSSTHVNPSLPDKPAIAVLPFENTSGDADQDYFVDGVTMEILTVLSRVDWLMVISRSSTFGYKGRAVDPKQVARELGVHYIVEGDVRKSADRVRVTATLVDGRNGHAIWVDRYDRAMTDVFALQDEIAQAIVGNIDSELKSSELELASRRQGDLSVWDKFQKGLWHFFKFTESDTERTRELMTELTRSAPEFALAHAMLAILDTRKVLRGFAEDRAETLGYALEHAKRAVALDDRSSIAHLALGRVYTMLDDYDEGISECETAVAMNPSSSLAYASLAMALFNSGRAAEAMSPIDTSIRLSPKGPGMPLKLVGKAWINYTLGHLEEAEGFARAIPHQFQTDPYRWLLLAAVCAHENRIEEARSAIDKVLEARSDMSLALFRKSWSHMTPEYLDMMLADLAIAGLPAESA